MRYILLLLLVIFCLLPLCGCAELAVEDNNPPVFLGAKRLVRYYPEVYIPEDAYFYLTWEPATDDFTPQDEIVYLVYTSTSGSDVFDTLPFETEPGATSWEVVAINYLSQTSYFGVRARDAAGNVDSNTIALFY